MIVRLAFIRSSEYCEKSLFAADTISPSCLVYHTVKVSRRDVCEQLI